jgi:hypothetical protein
VLCLYNNYALFTNLLEFEKMKSIVVLMILSCLALNGIMQAAETVVAEVTHTEFQAVIAAGEQTYTSAIANKVILEGILLHNPAEMLDPTPDDSITQTYNLGAQWQFFFQGEGEDHAGTAVYMAQLYNNLGFKDFGYSNQEFITELNRLNASQFSPGDRIRVTGYYLSYKGKNNINEQHEVMPKFDFTIELVKKGVGLPRPEVVTLDDLKDESDNFIFDQSRLLGCEYYQARLIKIKDVNFADPAAAAQNWGPNATLTITNGIKTFPVKLGRGNGIYAGSNNLTEHFDVIGILDQESSAKTGGYRLYVMNYDGNGSVLASTEHRRADKPGDLDLDGIVDHDDVYKLLEDWLK